MGGGGNQNNSWNFKGDQKILIHFEIVKKNLLAFLTTKGREKSCYAREFQNVKILDFLQSWRRKMKANVLGTGQLLMWKFSSTLVKEESNSLPFWKILLPPWVTISKDHPLNKNPRIQIILGPIKLNMITSNLQPQSHAQSIAPDQIQFATGVVNTVHHWFASTFSVELPGSDQVTHFWKLPGCRDWYHFQIFTASSPSIRIFSKSKI